MLFSIIFTIFLQFFIAQSQSLSQKQDDTQATNQILRSWIPWWPKSDDYNLNNLHLKSTPEITNILTNSTLETSEDEVSNSTETDVRYPSAVGGVPVDGTQLHLEPIPVSPLDSLKSGSEQISRNDGEFLVNFEQLGECPKDCSNDLRDAISIVLQDMSHIERYHKICGKYQTALNCVKEDERCGEEDRGMFEMMTSGFNYMCVEQEMAFNSTIKCIDDESTLVQSECEDQCQTRNLFMNWILRSTMQDTIQQGVNGIVGAATGTNSNPLAFLSPEAAQGGWANVLQSAPKPPQDPQQGLESFRQFTNDICRIGDCMLDCIRTKFNTRCEGSAGTLLSEMFVRPIATSQAKLTMLRPVLGIFMPEHCSFVYSSSDLKKHRIDATMDSELKRMYAEKYNKEISERAAQDELLANLVPRDANGVPLPNAIPELKPAEPSPLDVSVKSLDQLILELYSRNQTSVLENLEYLNETETDGQSMSSINSPIGYLETTNDTDKIEEILNFNTTVYEESTTTENERDGQLINVTTPDFEETSGLASGMNSLESSGEGSGDSRKSHEGSGALSEGSGIFSEEKFASGEILGTSGDELHDIVSLRKSEAEVDASGASGDGSGDFVVESDVSGEKEESRWLEKISRSVSTSESTETTEGSGKESSGSDNLDGQERMASGEESSSVQSVESNDASGQSSGENATNNEFDNLLPLS